MQLYFFNSDLQLLHSQTSKKINHASGGFGYICIAFADGTIHVLDRTTFELVKEIKTSSPVLTTVYNEEDQEFICAQKSLVVYLR